MTDKNDFSKSPEVEHSGSRVQASNDRIENGSELLIKSQQTPHKGTFRVHLSLFEGPVDLLLYLIKKNELDIHEIPLSQIVKDYLEYVELFQLIDLESAGDFLIVAAALMKIKTRSLFHEDEPGEEELEITTTKDELLRYLREFEKFGGVAEKLAEKEKERLGVYPRGGERSRIVEHLSGTVPEPDYALFDLFSALRDVLKNAPKTSPHDVELLNVTSEMKQREFMQHLARKGKIDFIEYVTGQPRLIIVITFVAMLELIKQRKIVVKQSKQFGKILVYARATDKSTDN